MSEKPVLRSMVGLPRPGKNQDIVERVRSRNERNLEGDDYHEDLYDMLDCTANEVERLRAILKNIADNLGPIEKCILSYQQIQFKFRVIYDLVSQRKPKQCGSSSSPAIQSKPCYIYTSPSKRHKRFRRKLLSLFTWLRDRRLKKLLKSGTPMVYTNPTLNRRQWWVNLCNPNFP